MRSFDPHAVGSIECRAWETYYRHEWATFLTTSVSLVRAAFRMPWPATLRGAWLVLRANQKWAPVPDNDRWISGEAAGDWSFNHFSRGPQGCPGTALARLLGVAALRAVIDAGEPALESLRDPRARCDCGCGMTRRRAPIYAPSVWVNPLSSRTVSAPR